MTSTEAGSAQWTSSQTSTTGASRRPGAQEPMGRPRRSDPGWRPARGRVRSSSSAEQRQVEEVREVRPRCRRPRRRGRRRAGGRAARGWRSCHRPAPANGRSSERPDEVEQQVVREVAAVRDAAALDPESARQTGGVGRRGDALPQLGHQAALADARLADEERDAAASGADRARTVASSFSSSASRPTIALSTPRDSRPRFRPGSALAAR